MFQKTPSASDGPENSSMTGPASSSLSLPRSGREASYPNANGCLGKHM
jgi:hypothetical protein